MTRDDMMLAQDVLRRDRKKQGMSQAYLARRLGVYQQTVSSWESGKSLIDDDVKLKLAQFLGPDSEFVKRLHEMNFMHAFDTFVPHKKRRKQTEWVGLNLDDIETLEVSKEWLAGARWAEAKLKQKNNEP
jgi:transcriptional regulator with XRE-family HTH domain